MKPARAILIILAAAAVSIGLGTPARAFHSGGVGECGGCHSMHNPAQVAGNHLLVASDPSSTCLSCHEQADLTTPSSFHVSTADGDLGATDAPYQRTPGGDFGWLHKTYVFTVRGTTTTEEGETHGHNIVAVDHFYDEDLENTTAPGGSMDSSDLGCQSCHDPHGRWRRTDDATATPAYSDTGAPIIGSGSYHNSAVPDANNAVGSYRLLAGVGYAPATGVVFNSNPPTAIAPSAYNRTEATTQTYVGYGNGMGDWCSNCHPDYHQDTSARFIHPTNQVLSSDIITNYNEYVASGDMSGSQPSSYLSLVSYEEGVGTTIAALKTGVATYSATASIPGPDDSERVMCLSCHRAHASGWEFGLRWNMEGEFITYNSQWPGIDNGAPAQFARGRTAAEAQAAYYDRDAGVFASYQRVLCNKCHAKD
jgi:hypothetical protein